MSAKQSDAVPRKRRTVRLNSIDDALAEVDRILEADRQGKLQHVGSWTAGQILGHVASWIDYGYEGYPVKSPPWFIRWFLRRRLPKMLSGSMPAGVRIPGVPGGTVGIEHLETELAAQQLRRAFIRLKDREPAKYDSPAFGSMSHDDRIRLNLRHAELHFSFLDY